MSICVYSNTVCDQYYVWQHIYMFDKQWMSFNSAFIFIGKLQVVCTVVILGGKTPLPHPICILQHVTSYYTTFWIHLGTQWYGLIIQTQLLELIHCHAVTQYYSEVLSVPSLLHFTACDFLLHFVLNSFGHTIIWIDNSNSAAGPHSLSCSDSVLLSSIVSHVTHSVSLCAQRYGLIIQTQLLDLSRGHVTTR